MEYFKHDLSASEDDKICELLSEGGYEYLGYYWRFIEYLYNRGGYVEEKRLKSVSWALHMDEHKLLSVVNDFGLFIVNDGIITSRRVTNELNDFSTTKSKMSTLGKASAKAKKEKNSTETQRTVERALNENATCVERAVERALNEPLNVRLTKENKENKENKEIDIKRGEERACAQENNEYSLKPPPPHKKQAYGVYKNVLLTADEFDALNTSFTNANEKIDYLSAYMNRTGKNYPSHFETILKWNNEDGAKKAQASTPPPLNNANNWEFESSSFDYQKAWDAAMRKTDEILQGGQDKHETE